MKKIMFIFALVTGCGVSQGSATNSNRFATREISVVCKNSTEIRGSEKVTVNKSKVPTKNHYRKESAIEHFVNTVVNILLAPLLYAVIVIYSVHGKLKTGEWPPIEI
jgi:hypothetical protein